MILRTDVESVATRLKLEFDDAFARPIAAEAGRENFLGLGLRGDPYALRFREIAGVLNSRRIVSFPTGVPAFAGLTAHRGGLVPVYDLGVLLGYSVVQSPRWIATVRTSDALVGLAFDRFDGHYSIPFTASDERSPSGILSVVPGLPDGRAVIEVRTLLHSVLQEEISERAKGATNPS